MDTVSDNTSGIKAPLPVGERLRHAVVTATNDDVSAVGTDKRARHIERLCAMQDAHAELNRLYAVEDRLRHVAASAINWLGRNATAENDTKAKAAFIEAYNAILSIAEGRA